MRSAAQLLYNFHWVVPGEAARAAQDYAGFLGPFLAGQGIAAIVNLRGNHPEFRWWRRETAICRKWGVAHFDAMLDSRLLPTRAMLAGLFDAFEAAPRPFLIKCSGGQDRTSLAAALFLLHRGQGMAAAMAQFARFPYLHFPKTQQRWLRQLPLYAAEQSKGQNLAGWIRGSYEPAQFAQWLNAHGLGHSYRGLYP